MAKHPTVLALLISSLLAAVVAAAPVAAASSRDPLQPLRAELEVFLADGGRTAAFSRQLAQRIGLAEAVARREASPDDRERLLEELRELRRRLAAAAPGFLARQSESSDFATASITGRVLAAATSVPLPTAEVTLFSQEGYYVGYQQTYGAAYRFEGLAAGTYFLSASDYSSTFAAQRWRQLPCGPYDCDPTGGTPIVLAPGQVFIADFLLADRGRIAGTVRAQESGQPLPNVPILVFDIWQFQVASTLTGADGTYSVGLATGNYYVVAADGERPGMLFEGVPCQIESYTYYLSCNTEAGRAVPASDGTLRSGIDFALPQGASVAGRVTDARTRGAVAGASVVLLDSNYRWVKDTITATDGSYLLVGLIAGRFNVIALGNGYTPQIFDRHNCPEFNFCRDYPKDPVAVATAQTLGGIDFALIRRSTVTGRILDESSGAPISGAVVAAFLPDGRQLLSSYSDSTGFFSLSDLPAGEVVVSAEASGFLAEYYDNVDRRAGVTAANRILLPAGEVTGGIDFYLQRLGSIKGRARAGDLPLYGCQVVARPVAGGSTEASYGYCQSDGSFELALPPGTYHLLTIPSDGSWAPQLLGAGSCNLGEDFRPLCGTSGATRVVVQAAQSIGPFEVTVERSVEISGSILATGNASSGLLRMHLHQADGRRVDTQYVDLYSASRFHFVGKAPGSYRVQLDGAPYWQSAMWDGVVCNRWYCDPGRGRLIEVAAGASADEISFTTAPLPAYDACHDSPTSLCLEQRRYRVEATWRDFFGNSGEGQAVRVTDATAYFWFFSPGNVELMVKALNACTPELGHHFWVFAAGLTNVEVELKVTDTLSGAVKIYRNSLGSTFQPVTDTGAFATCDEEGSASSPQATVSEEVAPAAAFPVALPVAAEVSSTCQPSGDLNICLSEGRFLATVGYRLSPFPTFQPSSAIRLTDDTAAFRFFSHDNIEVLLKVLDACHRPAPGYWVFAAGLTDVEVEINLLDTVTGMSKQYRGGPGPFQPILDFAGFDASCSP